MGFFLIVSICVPAQDQQVADSLVKLYRQNVLTDTAQLKLLTDLSFNEISDLTLSLKYADELIESAQKQGNQLYIHKGYFQKGNKKRLLGDLYQALDAYFKSAEAAEKAKFILGEASAYGAIADIYGTLSNHGNAMAYYNKAIAILRSYGDPVRLASVILNAGEEFRINKNYDSALLYFNEAKTIFEKENYLPGRAYCIGNIGMVYDKLGNSDLAEKNINIAIPMLEKLEDYYPICAYLISMSDIYLKKGNKDLALEYALKSLDLAKQQHLKEQIRDANLKVSELYQTFGNQQEAFDYYKRYIIFRDSINDIVNIQKMADLRTNFEISKKQSEVDNLNHQKRSQRIINQALLAILGLSIALSGTLFWYYRNISREKKRSENLLLNILPAETARELKQNGKVDAVKFEHVTVLFTDFVQFSKIAEQIKPEQLVRSLDYYFQAFDTIITKYGLEKIKTIGDSYMCASGLPTLNVSHARNAVLAAKEIVELVKSRLDAADDLNHFEIRVGLHTGPVVAGIVGIKKWQYDIWGDTVNIASRMESMSKPGRVNLSEKTYNEVKDEFPCEYRGEIEVKSHGPLKMYFLC
jgi:class 3 adenylate cyclase